MDHNLADTFQNITDRLFDQRQTGRIREPMVRAFDDGQLDIVALRMGKKALRHILRDHIIRAALQNARRKWERQWAAQDQAGAAILDQAAGDDIGFNIFVRDFDAAFGHDGIAFIVREPRPITVLGKVGRTCDCDQPRDFIRPFARQEQRHPAAHRRADQDDLTVDQVYRGAGVFEPIANAAILKGAIADAVTRVVEPQEPLPRCFGPFLKSERLGAFHVGL